jgi:hypothetical protein
MLCAIGIKLLISHNATPTTISTITMLIKGIVFHAPVSLSSNPIPSRGLGARRLDVSRELDNPAPLKQANYHNDYRNDQQQVNQPAAGVGGCHSQRPQNQQNYTDCPKHLLAPSRGITASAGPKRRVDL